MSLCLSWDIHESGQSESEITSLESSLNDFMSQTDIDEAHKIIETYNMSLRNKLDKTQLERNFSETVFHIIGTTGQRKDSEVDSYDSSQPDLHDLEEHKLNRPKNDWEPAPNKCSALESYIEAVESDIEKFLSMPDKAPDNKKLDKETYTAEAHRRLSDERFYKKQDSDPTKEFSTAIIKTHDKMFEKNKISINVYETLTPTDCRPGQFYLLPKIHKESLPGRSIVSAIGHLTDWRKFLNTLIYISVHRWRNCHMHPISRTPTDYIRKTPSTGLPDHALLVTMDVTYLYTNIPHDESIKDCREIWASRSIHIPSTESLAKLLEHVLRCSSVMENITCRLMALLWVRK
ncbi:uncharacterized protein LOC134240445 [Saccostrea cucullata]|uniref:uncharacterized protein LOC134240445 n=1 Tax=Saccostrea cuccullata TaxID=36930 RepID=UPI002ED527F8